MKTIEVKNEKFNVAKPVMEDISERLDTHGKGIPIDNINWKEFGYRPEVRFNIAYSSTEIFLKYYVKEKYFRADKKETNQMVCEDSCVEFFVLPESDGIYYNIEFNSIGTCLLGSGTGRKDSERAPVEIVSKIRRLSQPQGIPVKDKKGNYSWTLTLAIPVEIFFRHRITDLSGKTFRANFYKCGDKLEVPHYVTWNPIGTSSPDYHRPEYFGQLVFK
jgi:hypothetical protein